MTLLQQIQNEVVDSKSDLSSTLRKCRILAERLKNEEFKQWVSFELEGYDSPKSVPKYRIASCMCQGHFVGAFGRQIRNAQVPFLSVHEDFRKPLFEIRMTESVTGVQDMLTSAKGSSIRMRRVSLPRLP